ncbi:hypothetical protein GJ496_000988 [Pomphorhynchus laevis]|nr:hypothetical protein GJ496_000988 [Pomphorhynchus laevis]
MLFLVVLENSRIQNSYDTSTYVSISRTKYDDELPANLLISMQWNISYCTIDHTNISMKHRLDSSDILLQEHCEVAECVDIYHAF